MVKIYGVWILLLILVSSIAFSINSVKQRELARLEVAKESVLAKIDEYDKEMNIGKLETVSGSLFGFSSYFKDIANFTPNGVWLSNIVLSGQDGSVIMKGHAISSSGVSALLEVLHNVPNFRDKKFHTLQVLDRACPKR